MRFDSPSDGNGNYRPYVSAMSNIEPTPRRVNVWTTPGVSEWAAQLPDNAAFLFTRPTHAELIADLPHALASFFGERVEFNDLGPAP